VAFAGGNDNPRDVVEHPATSTPTSTTEVEQNVEHAVEPEPTTLAPAVTDTTAPPAITPPGDDRGTNEVEAESNDVSEQPEAEPDDANEDQNEDQDGVNQGAGNAGANQGDEGGPATGPLDGRDSLGSGDGGSSRGRD
jgi:hypothetical protein